MAPATDRYRRHRTRRQPVAVQSATITGEPVTHAIPVHRHNPAIQTVLGIVEIIAFAALVLTASPLALGALGGAIVAYVAAYAADVRAVVALHPGGRGTLLSAGRSGRPMAVIGPATVETPLPATPTGLSTPLTVDATTWWVDRSSYRSLAAPDEPRP